ncbi:MAG: hypothetical protein R6X18_02625 [Chloroflexota bacterium]|jgi:hypothetical protein
MASLFPYIAKDAQAGQKVELKIHEFMIWKSVGRGEILTLTDNEVNINGHLSIIVYSGDLNIHLQLSDADETAFAGSCVLQINSHVDEKASYRVEKGVLGVTADFDGKQAGIRLSSDHGGKMTRCDLSGFLGITAYLEAVR